MARTNARLGRREFLKATAAGVTIVAPTAVRGSQANSRLEIGVIGSGGRGRFVVAALRAAHQHQGGRAARLLRRSRRQRSAKELSVDAGARFTGLDGYRALLDRKLDAVAIESPPYFHPEQAVAALEAGKHLYLAKPIAVDVAGCLAVERAAKAAGASRKVLVDFQTRRDPLFREAAERVHRGDIGPAVLGHVFYHAGRLSPKAPPGHEHGAPAQLGLRSALSGDIIVEQNIHVIDVANWYLQARPVKAQGTGGRKARVDVGDCWDHFVVTYTYPNGVLVDFSSAQFTKGFDDLRIRVYGARGTVDSAYDGDVRLTGDVPWAGGSTKGPVHERHGGEHPGLPCRGDRRPGTRRYARAKPREQSRRDSRPQGRVSRSHGHVGRDDEGSRPHRRQAAAAQGRPDVDDLMPAAQDGRP